MSISQSSNSSSNAELAQLLEVDAQLVANEADLIAQLQSIQQKRQSLKTVIDMFAAADTARLVEAPTRATDPNGTLEPSALAQQPALSRSVDTNNAVEEAVQEIAIPQSEDSQLSSTPSWDVNDNSELSALKQEIQELDGFQADSQDAITPALEQPNRNQKKAPTKANRGRTAKTARATNQTKKTQGWQDYLREEFSDVPLSVAVSAVLQQQQEQALDINSVVDAIFVQQMPPDVGDKARDRVNNILSEGARKNKWYREAAGSYSMSPVVTESN